jgi:hypothetical protein
MYFDQWRHSLQSLCTRGGASNIGRVILGRVRMVTVCEIYVEPGIVCIPSAGSSIYSQLAVQMLHSNTACWIKYKVYRYKTGLNDLQRNGLTRCRMIWLLPHQPPPYPISKLDRRHTGRLRKRDNLLTGEGGGGGGGRAQVRRRRESLVLYISFKPLWSVLWLQGSRMGNVLHSKKADGKSTFKMTDSLGKKGQKSVYFKA